MRWIGFKSKVKYIFDNLFLVFVALARMLGYSLSPFDFTHWLHVLLDILSVEQLSLCICFQLTGLTNCVKGLPLFYFDIFFILFFL